VGGESRAALRVARTVLGIAPQQPKRGGVEDTVWMTEVGLGPIRSGAVKRRSSPPSAIELAGEASL
jgi:hypothetical protein